MKKLNRTELLAIFGNGYSLFRPRSAFKDWPIVKLEVRNEFYGDHFADVCWDAESKRMAATRSTGWFLKKHKGLYKQVEQWLKAHGAEGKARPRKLTQKGGQYTEKKDPPLDIDKTSKAKVLWGYSVFEGEME